MPYSELREALRPGGFFVDNLWHLTRVAYALARSGDVRHPVIPLTIAGIAERVANAWDGMPVDADHADRVEHDILPKLQALIELADTHEVDVVNSAVRDVLEAADVALASR